MRVPDEEGVVKVSDGVVGVCLERGAGAQRIVLIVTSGNDSAAIYLSVPEAKKISNEIERQCGVIGARNMKKKRGAE